MTVRTKSDLRIAYNLIRDLTGWKQEFAGREGFSVEKANELIADYKRSIREYYKWKDEVTMNIVKDYGIDGYVELFQFPDNVESMEEAEEYFDYECRLTCPLTMYDCTGRPFTEWHKVFVRRGKYHCYHRVGYDV